MYPILIYLLERLHILPNNATIFLYFILFFYYPLISLIRYLIFLMTMILQKNSMFYIFLLLYRT